MKRVVVDKHTLPLHSKHIYLTDMKTRLFILVGIFLTASLAAQVTSTTSYALIGGKSLSSIGVAGNNINDKEKAVTQKKTEEVTFAVNMHCDNCKARIERALTWHKGVKDLEVKLKALTVRVRFDSRKTSVQDIQQAITTLGYTCEPLP
jgi:copper chaperone CopZ